MTRSHRIAPVVTALILGTAALFPSLGFAQIYQYVGPDGSVHYSNVRMEEKYRPYTLRADIPYTTVRTTEADRKTFYGLIDRMARVYRMDPALIRAVVRVESNFDPRAVSSAGAIGLMQLMPGTAQDLSVENPFDPEQNVQGGVRYLRYLLDRFDGDTALALAAYHAGERRVDRHNGIPPIPATRDYVNRVLKHQVAYRRSIPQPEPLIYQVGSGDSVHYTTTAPSVTFR